MTRVSTEPTELNKRAVVKTTWVSFDNPYIMGWLEKAAAYRWLSAGRGGSGGGDAGLVLVIIFGAIALVAGIVYGVVQLVSFLWGIIYGTVRPVLSIYPPVTIPSAVVFSAWVLTLIGPYSTEKTRALVDRTSDGLSFATRTGLAIVVVNFTLLVSYTESFPEQGGLLQSLFGLGFALVLLYGFYVMFHFPYRCLRLILHIPKGAYYSIAFLSPLLFILISGIFEVPVTNSSSSFVSQQLADALILMIFNVTYIGGGAAVLWKQDAIRTQSFGDKDDGNRGTEESIPPSKQASEAN